MRSPDVVDDFDDVLEGRVANGIATFAGVESVADLATRVGAAGWRLLYVDVSTASGKDDVLHVWRNAADFPDWFGGNWDALADSLTDLSWLHAEGYVVLYEGHASLAVTVPEVAETSLQILAEAAAAWADNGTPFVALMRERPAKM